MKVLDKFIRFWRVTVALKYCPEIMNNVFDIGCDDGCLLKRLSDITKKQDGIDPRLNTDLVSSSMKLKKGYFPSAIEEFQMQGGYDAIFALAVFEHFTEKDIQESAIVISSMLSPKGRLIITVPQPFVDKILDALIFLRLIEGQALEEHHGFEPDELVTYFSSALRLVKRKKFQLGLNNVFIFEKI